MECKRAGSQRPCADASSPPFEMVCLVECSLLMIALHKCHRGLAMFRRCAVKWWRFMATVLFITRQRSQIYKKNE